MGARDGYIIEAYQYNTSNREMRWAVKVTPPNGEPLFDHYFFTRWGAMCAGKRIARQQAKDARREHDRRTATYSPK